MEKAKQYFCAKPNGKLHYPHTILTGFGFLASSIAWAIYDPYITKILNHLLNNSATITSWSAKLNAAFPALAEFAAANGEDVTTAAGGITLVPLFIGIIMTFDNIFGVIFQPTFGKLSDNTHSRFGKRRPYVIFGAPISAILFAIIPIVAIKVGSLPLTMLFIILFVFVMSLWRAPVVALMPDLTPSDIRSEGNAVINLMGGIGGALGLFAGTIVTAIYCASTGISSKSPEFNELNTFPYVFLLGAAVMVIGMLIILFFVKEPDSRIKVQGEMNQAADAEARRKAEKEAAKAEKEARKNEILYQRKKREEIILSYGKDIRNISIGLMIIAILISVILFGKLDGTIDKAMGVVSGLVHVVISLAVIVLINKISLERLLFITVFGIVDLIFSIFAVMSFGWCFVYTVVDIVIIFHAIKAYRVLRRRMDME